jgi:hypothetical protein
LDDLAACIFLYMTVTQLNAAYPSHALHAACLWAQISHCHGNLPSALHGYHAALELFQKVAWLGLSTPSHQDTPLREKSEDLGCLAATCAIQLGHIEEAVELLDLAQSFFWQQASWLQTDLEILKVEDAELAETFRIGNFFASGPLFSAHTHDIEIGQQGVKEIGRQHRCLVGEWEEIVEKIRMLPQFKYFLRSIPFAQLRQASIPGWSQRLIQIWL